MNPDSPNSNDWKFFFVNIFHNQLSNQMPKKMVVLNQTIV